jgi:phage repressor protein C with HTH and peptisase S24 domain
LVKHEGEILQNWLDSKRWSALDLANELGMSKQNVYYHLKRDEISSEFKEKLEKKGFDVFAKKDKSNVKHASLDNGKSNMFLVPLKAYGGFLNGYSDTVFLESLEKVSFPFIKGDCYAFEVEGFSGSPDYNPGDYVIATPVEKFEWLRKNQVYVFQTIDGLLLKVFDKIEGNLCHVHSINEDYNPVAPFPVKSLKKVYYKEYTIKK